MASILLIVNGVSSFTALDDEFIRCCQQVVVIDDISAILTDFIDISVQVISSLSEVVKILPTVQTDFIAYLPYGIDSITLPDTTLVQNYLAPLLPEVTLPQETAMEIPLEFCPPSPPILGGTELQSPPLLEDLGGEVATTSNTEQSLGWIASTEIAKFALPRLKSWTILEIAQVLENAGVAFLWGGVAATHNITQEEVDKKNNLQVLAIVTHYRCEVWLKRCLESLVNQTRAPDRIVVIDDASENAPISIVEQFPQVTLLASSVNVGTYRLIQQVISDTNYDAYLFQDADDWSMCDRLERLLQALTVTGAELVGTQELRVYENGQINPVCYPLDVNAALKEKPGHPLIHPSSLVKRDLVMRLGGFATGLRFGGDTEFLLRASIVAKVVNIPYYYYYRRKRQGSLTTAANTGLNSPARQELIKVLKSRALANYAALQANQSPCLTPLTTASPIKLKHIAGFPL